MTAADDDKAPAKEYSAQLIQHWFEMLQLKPKLWGFATRWEQLLFPERTFVFGRQPHPFACVLMLDAAATLVPRRAEHD